MASNGRQMIGTSLKTSHRDVRVTTRGLRLGAVLTPERNESQVAASIALRYEQSQRRQPGVGFIFRRTPSGILLVHMHHPILVNVAPRFILNVLYERPPKTEASLRFARR